MPGVSSNAWAFAEIDFSVILLTMFKFWETAQHKKTILKDFKLNYANLTLPNFNATQNWSKLSFLIPNRGFHPLTPNLNPTKVSFG